jgi:hypothetical protein
MNRFLLAAALALAGCTPSIGDKCVLNTDCSLQGTRVCDTSQPNGYCTIFNCQQNSCPGPSGCVLFHPNVSGCPYDDYQSPSRAGRSFCLANCQGDSDCRQSEGYVCRDVTQPPWNAAILDNNQAQRFCVIAPDTATSNPAAPPGAGTSVCGPSDAGAGADAGGADAAPDGAPDAGPDAGPDATPEAGPDAAPDARPDAGPDAADAGAADAAGGG